MLKRLLKLSAVKLRLLNKIINLNVKNRAVSKNYYLNIKNLLKLHYYKMIKNL